MAIGLYSIFQPAQNSNNVNQPPTSQTLTVPIYDFYFDGWDYGPTVEYAGHPNPIAVWMGGAGEIIYHPNLQSAPVGSVKLSAILSGELHRDRAKVIGDGTSDVEVLVNGNSIATQNVVRDNDRFGQQYSWMIPEGYLKSGVNEITFRVKKGKTNGLNVWKIGATGGIQLDK